MRKIPGLNVIVIIFTMLVIVFEGIETGNSQVVDRGWINDDTYQYTMKGSPFGKQNNRSKRRNSARDTVTWLNRNFLAGLYGACDNSLEYTLKTDREQYDYALKMIGKNSDYDGKIINEKFDDNDNCFVTYQIYKKGLKGIKCKKEYLEKKRT